METTMEALRQSCASRKSRVVAGLVSGGLLVLALAAVVVTLATLTADHRRAASHEMLAAEEGRSVGASGVGGAAVGGAAVPAAALAGSASPREPDALTAEGKAMLQCQLNCGDGNTVCGLNDYGGLVYCMCNGVITPDHC